MEVVGSWCLLVVWLKSAHEFAGTSSLTQGLKLCLRANEWKVYPWSPGHYFRLGKIILIKNKLVLHALNLKILLGFQGAIKKILYSIPEFIFTLLLKSSWKNVAVPLWLDGLANFSCPCTLILGQHTKGKFGSHEETHLPRISVSYWE